MCEPSERECAALTWTLRVGVADQYWRYVHDVKRTLEVRRFCSFNLAKVLNFWFRYPTGIFVSP